MILKVMNREQEFLRESVNVDIEVGGPRLLGSKFENSQLTRPAAPISSDDATLQHRLGFEDRRDSDVSPLPAVLFA